MTRRVLITAGANGIGLVMARAFAGLGDRVWVTDVDAMAVASLPPGIRGTVCDASSEAAMDLLFAEVARDWGGLDVAIANAGALPSCRPYDPSRSFRNLHGRFAEVRRHGRRLHTRRRPATLESR